MAVGMESRLKRGSGNAGPAVAGWMETRGGSQFLVIADAGWVVGQLEGSRRWKTEKRKSKGKGAELSLGFHRVSTAGETTLWKTQ